ncbi:MAG: hypothetical protein A2682_03960 [Candidatus Terrybacteria bacterium RIFCSPHIGHO2_01_FULL_58_15]|uniref:Uncharacterized protein n=2 Tax=Candidatus Terryibacteriota TaxID=1817920 RepID=A0A1G2PJK1_TERXR|nr:MAG: hypothetical protein A2682_03960 [Candidatus Terrybacteria bacterium RIFCSPHIGHO2_01_FULL_58_15]
MIFRRGERGDEMGGAARGAEERAEKEEGLARLRRDRDGLKKHMVGKTDIGDADQLERLRHRIDALRQELKITEPEQEWSAEQWRDNEK